MNNLNRNMASGHANLPEPSQSHKDRHCGLDPQSGQAHPSRHCGLDPQSGQAHPPRHCGLDPQSGQVPSSNSRSQSLLEIGLILVTLFILVWFTIIGYFTGTFSPGGDFFSHYSTEAFAWWRFGSFFRPPNWMPFMWGGYPAAASWQNSAFYLPVGIIASLVPFTIRVAALLNGLHLIFGALGAYVLVRRYGLGLLPALFAFGAYFFGVAFFGNAQHTDIVRGFAWLPWVLLCTSPKWHWHRVWAVPVATVILWQTLVATYPGVTVMMVYGVVAWIVLTRIGKRRGNATKDLLPLAIAGIAAVLMFLIKALPFFLVRGAGGAVAEPPTAAVGLGIISTLFFNHESIALQGVGEEPTMRSLFVIAPTLPLVMCAKKSRLVLGGLGLIAVAAVIGIPTAPWSPIIELLPGIGLSRFQWADSRILLMIGIIVIAANGLHNLMSKHTIDYLPARLIAILLVPLAAFLLARYLQFPAADSRLPLLLTALATIMIGGWLAAKRFLAKRFLAQRLPDGWASANWAPVNWAPVNWALGSLLIIIGIISGVNWANSFTDTPWSWQVDRVRQEIDFWGNTSGTLVADWPDSFASNQRPPRAALPEDVEQLGFWGTREANWNLVFFTGQQSIGGYVNLGTESMLAIERSVITSLNGDPTAAHNARAFWAAPGIIIAAPAGNIPPAATTELCVADGLCGNGLYAIPTGYEPGWWHYDVVAETDTLVALNEAYYPGFSISICAQTGPAACLEATPRMGLGGNVEFELPAGAWVVQVEYRTPGVTFGWFAFALGVALALVWPISILARNLTGNQTRSGTCNRTRQELIPSATPPDAASSPTVSAYPSSTIEP